MPTIHQHLLEMFVFIRKLNILHSGVVIKTRKSWEWWEMLSYVQHGSNSQFVSETLQLSVAITKQVWHTMSVCRFKTLTSMAETASLYYHYPDYSSVISHSCNQSPPVQLSQTNNESVLYKLPQTSLHCRGTHFGQLLYKIKYLGMWQLLISQNTHNILPVRLEW